MLVFFSLIEVESNTEVCDICKGHFTRTTYYRHIQTTDKIATLFKKIFEILSVKK